MTEFAPGNFTVIPLDPVREGMPALSIVERTVFKVIRDRFDHYKTPFIDSARGISYRLQDHPHVIGRAIKSLVKKGLLLVEKVSRYKSMFLGIVRASDTQYKASLTMKDFSTKRKNAAAAAASKSRDVQRKNASLRDLNEALDFAASERPTKPAQQAQQIKSPQKKSRKGAGTPKRESLPTPNQRSRKQEQQCPQSYRRPRPCVNSTSKARSTMKTPESYKRPLNGDLRKKSGKAIQQGQDSKRSSSAASKTPLKFERSLSERLSKSEETELRKKWERQRWKAKQRTQRLKDGDAYYTTSTPLTDVNVWAALGLQNTADDSQKSNTQAHKSSRTQRRNGGRHTTTTSPAENQSASSSGSPRWGENSKGRPATPRQSREMGGVNTKWRSLSETSSTDSRPDSSFTATPTGTTRRFDKSHGTGSSRWLMKPSESERGIDRDDR